MRPIQTGKALSHATVVHHPAFGFAHVKHLDGPEVHLRWEQPDENLPTVVHLDVLRGVYSYCRPDGFFAQALRAPDRVREQLHANPVGMLEAILIDLDGPQRKQDLMDWLTGLELLDMKDFHRWWSQVLPLIQDESHIELRAGTIAITRERSNTATSPSKKPNTIEHECSNIPDTPGDPPRTLSHWRPDANASTDGIAKAALPLTPTRLSDLSPSHAPLLPMIGRSIACALMEVHSTGQAVEPAGDRTWIDRDGKIRFDLAASSINNPDRDIRDAGTMLVESLLGRPLPPTLPATLLMPYLRGLVADIPPSAMAALDSALHLDEAMGPPDGSAWVNQWEAIAQAEAARKQGADNDQAELVFGYDSHIGREKLLWSQTNQDTVAIGQRGPVSLFLVCDGITNCDIGSGDMASGIATRVLTTLWERALPQLDTKDGSWARAFLIQGLELANKAVCEAAIRLAKGRMDGMAGMGSTVVIGVSQGDRIHLAWLGDSRAYLVGPYGTSLLTSDHNEAAERLKAWHSGILGHCHPAGASLVRYLGHFDATGQPSSMPSGYTTFRLQPGERVLLTTDGLTDYVAQWHSEVADAITALAGHPDLDEACWEMVLAANRAGGGDNITVLLCQLAEAPT